ncbi:MAG TPA: aminotransferase class V-fold PLP-dependent enzyme [Trebonia sp.]
MTFALNEQWRLFRANRPPTTVAHLDTAAAGRSSVATLRAVAAHAEREATVGAYVAQAEAAGVLKHARAMLAGLFAVEPGGIAFTESATASLEALLRAWPLAEGDTVAVAPSEWGPNLDSFCHRGLRVAELPTGRDGIVDLDALPGFLAAAPPAFVHLTPVASHRPLVQPAAAVAAACRAAGVPLWMDAAQALGHIDVACGADAAYGTSRKWLAGPRGVGLIAVPRPWWERLRPAASAMECVVFADASPLLLIESHEAHVAGRVGLAAAVSEFLAADPAAVRARLAEVGRQTRAALAAVPGWEVVPEAVGADPASGSAITALRPLAGQDVAAVRGRLLAEHQIVTTAALPVRAPREMTGPLLRVSPHVDCVPEDLERLAAALPAR